ncbi:MAG: glycoside hydrolase family 15 protein, partial [Ktedonobacterales bacterium]|nr:glycoside hydrolase family 15 protein [Ktedonobacterales bacterium]
SGPYQQAILRSALALKLCTFEPTGAIVAAPTTSLPEAIGGVRNWDYRFTWLRDASFTLDALQDLGFTGEARDYFHFLHDLHLHDGSELRIMYGIHGETGAALAEHELPNLAGYRRSRPVRIGNGAATQRQMDIYGEFMDAAYQYYCHGQEKTRARRHESLRSLHRLVAIIADYVTDHWQTTDRGIWEVRGAPRAFVHSRVMCWLALDRACRMASRWQRGRAKRWAAARDAIRADVLAHGYNEQVQSFTQAYGDIVLDAADLRLAIVDFLPPTDPRIQHTVLTTDRELATRNGLVYRYKPVSATQGDVSSPASGVADDGLPGSEGAFTVCSFWLIRALCQIGRVAEARDRFNAMLRYASPLGLFSEEIDAETGALLGNYPQAFTHIGLITAAVALQRAEEGRNA